MATSVVFGPIENSRFMVTVHWTNKDGSLGQHSREYHAGSVFFINGTLGVKLKRPICRTADELTREVLGKRSALV